MVEIAIFPAGADLGALAKSRGAFAAIMVSRPADATTGILVHVVDCVTGKSTTRLLEAAKRRTDTGARRASSGRAPLRVAPGVADCDALRRRGETDARRRSGGRTALAHPGGVSRLGAPRRRERLRGTGGASVCSRARGSVLDITSCPASASTIPLGLSAPTVISTSDATSDFALLVGRAGAMYEPWPKFALSPALGVDGDCERLHSWFERAPGANAFRLGQQPFVGLSMAMAGRLRHDLRLRADVEVGRTFDPLIVRFGGEPVAHFGPSWAAITLGLEWVAAR